jgi:hypothetical protein
VFMDQVRNVIAEPLADKIDLKHLFILTGIIMVFTGLWAFILAYIKSAAMELVE